MMEFALGTFGSPGIVIIAPVTTTINPAPAESLTSLTGTVNPVGAPLRAGLVEKLYCVLQYKWAVSRSHFPQSLN